MKIYIKVKLYYLNKRKMNESLETALEEGLKQGLMLIK
jgi:hypothetical protein